MKVKVIYTFIVITILVIISFILFLHLRNVKYNHNLVEIPVISNNYVYEDHPIILHIQQPLHDFHTDHWFHMSEYFLSHINEIQNTYNSIEYANNRPISFHIIGNTPLFSSKLTKMALFLLVLTISNYKNLDQIISNIYVYDSLHYCDSHSTNIHCFDSYSNTNWGNKSCYLIVAPLKMHGVIRSSGQYTSYKYNLPDVDHNNRVLCDPIHFTLGYKPMPKSQWFLNKSDATMFRRKLNGICPTNSLISTKLKVVLYNRNFDRIFLNFNAAIESIVKALPLHVLNNLEITPITHDEDREPCELKNIMNNADIVITSHGFQCTALLFMKEGSLLYEIFPYKYFRTTYLDLSLTYGVNHKCIQMQQPSSITRSILRLIPQDKCMNSGLCRNFARKDNIYLTQNEITDIVHTIINYSASQDRK